MKKPGRPPLDAADPSVRLTIVLPSKHMIALCQRAERERRTLPELVRVLLKPTAADKKFL